MLFPAIQAGTERVKFAFSRENTLYTTGGITAERAEGSGVI
jgi:hypothetical protein